MPNERLREAIRASGLNPALLGPEIGVDPKTVERWIATDRTPYPRHRRRIAQVLEEREEYLWPGLRRGGFAPADDQGEIVAAYPYRTDLDIRRWWDLFRGAEREIDLLGFTLYFLWQQHPDLVGLLREKTSAGVRLRVALADPESEHVHYRDREEGQAITIVARIKSSLAVLAGLGELEGVETRFQDAPLYNSLFRFDDQMLVTPHLYAVPGHAAPLLHLRRLSDNGLFSRFATHFDGLWAEARSIGQDHDKKAMRHAG